MTYDPRVDDMSDNSSLPIGAVIMYDELDWVDDTTMCGWYSMMGGTVPAGKPKEGCAIPDVREKFLRAACYGTQWCIGLTGGANSITLETCQMPEHSHCMKEHGHNVSGTAAGQGGGGHCHFTFSNNAGIDAPSSSNYIATSYFGTVGDTDYAMRGHGTAASVGKTSCTAHTHSSSSLCTNSCAALLDIGNSCTAGLACAVDNQPAYYSIIYIKRMY